MIAGKVAVVCGYGDVGKGSAQALKLSPHKFGLLKLTLSVRFKQLWRATK